MKLLFITNISGTKIGTFSLASIKAAQDLGIEFHMAANFANSTKQQMKLDEENYNIKLHHIDFIRNPLNLANKVAYKQVIELIQQEKFDVIHCNTPIGGVVGRIAGKKCGVPTIIYQAHGFHFYDGAPIKNWLIYYPIERVLAHSTDAIVTINQEDFERAQKFHLRHNGKVYYVPGVGLNTSDYLPDKMIRTVKRNELGLSEKDVMVISAGDLIKRKNYKTSIEAIAHANNEKIHYFICGQGPLRSELEALAEQKGVGSQVHFLGYRTDIKELLWAADLFLFSTFQEGLPRSLSEAMAAGLPCIASKIRGNTDLLLEGYNGYLISPNDYMGFSRAISDLSKQEDLRKSFSNNSLARIKKFSLDAVKEGIYNTYFNVIK